MSVHDYLIDHSKFNWLKLLAGWSGLLPKEFSVWLMNRFGDLFLLAPDGSIHRLDVGRGRIERVAKNQDDFLAKMDDEATANQWLVISLVDALVKAGLSLPPGQCYGFKVSPALGGGYTVDNTTTLPFAEHYALNARLHAGKRKG
jgi:hypothetical protein